MKILNIIPRYPPAIGGSESWCARACRFLAKKGIVTRVAAMDMYNAAEAFDENFKGEEFIKLGEEDYDEGVYVRRYALWKPWSNLSSARIIRFMTHKLGLAKTQIGNIFMTSPNSFQMYRNLFSQINDVDVVLVHTLPYFHNLIGYLIARICRKPIVAVPHFHPGHKYFERKIFYQMLKNCDAVITVSRHEKEHLISKGVREGKIHVLGNAIDPEIRITQCTRDAFNDELRAKFGFSQTCKKIIFIGRKEVYKGVFILIDALNRLADEDNLGLELFLIGPDTPDFNRIYPEIFKSERLKIINFGVVSEQEKESLISISDVLVLPSEFEAFGIVFLEAWKYSKPVIGMSHGAVPEVIADAGLCAEYGNIDDLKQKIKMVLSNPKLAKIMGAKGRKKLEHEYSLDVVYGKVRNILYALKKYQRKIMIVSHLFPPRFIGGSEVVAYEQSRCLRELGWKVKIFTGKIDNSLRRYSISRESSQFEVTCINLHQEDFNHQRCVDFDRDELREAFRRELNDFAPDIVHFHNIYGFSLGMVDDCNLVNIPIVMTLHDYWGICPKNLLLDKSGGVCSSANGQCDACNGDLISPRGGVMTTSERNRKCIQYYNKANLLISPSEYLADRFIERNVPEDKFKVIRNGIDLSRFKAKVNARDRKIRIAFIGQIIWHKGTDTLLEALKLLGPNETKKIKVSIIGSGESEYLKYCKDMASQLNFVKFYGKINNSKIHTVYGKTDILVAPSRWPENSPLVMQEAMACGIPVIASDFGAIPELVKDGKNGLLFKLNDPESLAKTLKQVIENPDKINIMSRFCFQESKENDLCNRVSAIAEQYRRIIK